MVTIHLDEQQADKLIRLIEQHQDPTLNPIIEQIEKEMEWEHETRFCNTECPRYRQGTCPYTWRNRSECPRYKNNDV